MAIWRMQCEFGADSPDVRDRLVITPHFNDTGALYSPGSALDGLCMDLANALDTWDTATRHIEVTAYDAQGSVPVRPQGHAVKNANAFPQSSGPREVALCLSFYSQFNEPRRRGRLYIPWTMSYTGATARPTLANRDKVLELGSVFKNLGGVDIDWSVYSRVDDTARAITNYYVDDEWDTVRSRGLRPTTRSSGTASE